MQEWICEIDFDPEDYFGFCYIITNNITGKKYIGRKSMWQNRLRPPLKGRTRKRRIREKTDWRKYWGSCDELLSDIKKLNIKNFTKEIISLHKSKGDCNQHEIKLQFQYDVLTALLDNGKHAYYNKNIMGRFFSQDAKLYKNQWKKK